MKNTLRLFLLAILTIGLLGSCSKINERLDGLDKRINNLENDKIASVEQQITAINQSIADLGTIRTNIQTLMDAKTAMGEDITKLKEADQALEGKIAELKTYLDTNLAKYATTEWANATFATLEKQAEIIADVTKLKQDLAGLEAALDQAIEDLDSSLKAWVNEQLSAYSTTAQMEAKIKALQDQIDALKADNETNKSDIEDLEADLAQLEQDLESAKATIKTAYEKAIKDALESNNGYITEKIKRAISSANGSISSLSSRVGTLETQVGALLKDVDALKKMIQSVTIIPAYSDGSVEADENGIVHIDCIISPASAVSSLTKANFTILVNKDGAITFKYITEDERFSKDASKGTISLAVPMNILTSAGSAITVAVRVNFTHRTNLTSDITTEFVPVYTPASAPATFKAVHNTTDGSLTFYYDNSLHIGEGVLYDNLPVNATAYASWGYDGIRGNIKSVKIEPSVEGYKGLTSTAYMFFNMTEAESISGAEYLDVSNVKDMTYMFCAYGRSSTSLTDVPVVSGWKTDNVEKMVNLFSTYGQNSTSLTAVPDVSGWNTGNVTDMGNMFSDYGKYSTSLTAVPDVSGWKTDNVEKMGNLFANYGDANKNNINCVLDLTGWNLANLTTGNVFNNFSPNTFKVTIPAKTGENANLPSKWYGSGTYCFYPPTDKTFTLLPADALAGRFSVSATKKVHFSKGNLYAEKEEGSETWTWNFYSEQYKCNFEYGTGNRTAASTDVKIDLFTWGYGTFSTNPVTTECASDTFADWGTALDGNGTWRTLSAEEWKYLFNKDETYGTNIRSNKYKCGVTVCNVTNCLVIAPDDYNGTIAASYDETAWAKAEADGLVCLPPAGTRYGTDVYFISVYGYYRTSSKSNDDIPLLVSFDGTEPFPGISLEQGKNNGFSVRLITECQ